MRILGIVFVVLGLGEILKLLLFPKLTVGESQFLSAGWVTAGAVVAAYWIARRNRAIRKRIEKERWRRIDAEVEGERIRRQIRSAMGAEKPPRNA